MGSRIATADTHTQRDEEECAVHPLGYLGWAVVVELPCILQEKVAWDIRYFCISALAVKSRR
jgi:hypothetical protein